MEDWNSGGVGRAAGADGWIGGWLGGTGFFALIINNGVGQKLSNPEVIFVAGGETTKDAKDAKMQVGKRVIA